MPTRGRVILASSIMLLGASVALVACVGDDPTASTNQSDASTSTDGSSATDAAVADTGSSTTSDASDAATETFDGSNPTCNGLFPQDAPAVATIECDGGLISGTLGGSIKTGRYYLIDQKYPSAFCPTSPTGYSDVIVISDAGDGGLIVNAALNNAAPFNTRLTLAWSAGGTTFNQSDTCPNDGHGQSTVPFAANADGTLVYQLPTFGDLTFKPF
jgi:hypothetical protein